MANNILVLCGSSRKDGNTEQLADAFIEGAKRKGHEVEKVTLCQMKVQPCMDCKYCYNHEETCALKDDMQQIYEKMLKAEILVLASPVYFYGFPAKLKAVFDRLHNPIRDKFHIKGMCLLTAYADEGEEVYKPMQATYQAIGDYLGWKDLGMVWVDQVEDRGAVIGHKALEQAEALGEALS